MSTNGASTMAEPSFQGLPLELRQQIYEDLFEDLGERATLPLLMPKHHIKPCADKWCNCKPDESESPNRVTNDESSDIDQVTSTLSDLDLANTESNPTYGYPLALIATNQQIRAETLPYVKGKLAAHINLHLPACCIRPGECGMLNKARSAEKAMTAISNFLPHITHLEFDNTEVLKMLVHRGLDGRMGLFYTFGTDPSGRDWNMELMFMSKKMRQLREELGGRVKVEWRIRVGLQELQE